jgi:pyruvate formate lyase activating enzyme
MPRRLDPAVVPLADALQRRTVEGRLSIPLENNRVRCVACGHRCVILPGLDGVCRVRFNDGGTLRVPFGYVAGVQIDPIEKKPFFHAFPGSDALSFGMLGCDLHCGYCQNWVSSQALRDPAAAAGPRDITADELAGLAASRRVPVMVSTYNEPLITAEWAVAVFERAKEAGIVCGFISNGHATPEALAFIRPYVDLYKVDLKGFRDEHYRELGGRLAPVLESIGQIHAMGFWLEIVTLLIPGFNDDPAELRELARFIASVSPDVPWHVTAFHRDYRMTGGRDTASDDLVRAAAIGREAGLRHVYAGNRPGAVGELENTRCPGCGATVIERHGYHTTVVALKDDGCCSRCGCSIAGFWPRGWREAARSAGAVRAPKSVAFGSRIGENGGA